jgi:RNA-directed DNA polymerase
VWKLFVREPGGLGLDLRWTPQVRIGKARSRRSQALERVRLAARRGKQERFTSLLHHINPEMLRAAFYALTRDAAPGINGMTWETYEQALNRRIEDLHVVDGDCAA